MSESIIEVKNIGKKYNITHERGGYVSLRDVLMNAFAHPFKFIGAKAKTAVGLQTKEEFWALKDVSFSVKKGEVLGIIGRNGAGKSTILKILSRITPPTTGEIVIQGRVVSLLEVGTGFHPELSGRENIFFNGAILGMSRKEIISKFDEIVQFAGVEKFLDTPVKHYSSGMQVRLAFSVAAHLEPDILIIDEVLAVGDAEFQKKCLGKMDEVTKRDGRTIIFVSHSMNAVEQLCDRCLILNNGQIANISADVKSVVKEYIFGDADSLLSNSWINTTEKFNNPWWKPLKIYLADKNNEPLQKVFSPSDEVWVHIEAEVAEIDPGLTVGYSLYNEENEILYWTHQNDTSEENEWPKISKGKSHIKSKLPMDILALGTYKIELIGSLHYRKWIFEPYQNNPGIYFSIQGSASSSPFWTGNRPTPLSLVIKWENEMKPND